MKGPGRRRWLPPTLVAVSALMTAILALFTNVATGLIPDGWAIARNPAVIWSATGAFLLLTVISAVVAARATDAGSTSDDVLDRPLPISVVLDRPSRWPVLAIPDLRSTDVARPGVMHDLAGAVTRPAEDRPATISLCGAGGFGKTTLARSLVNRADVRGHFPDGILWITLGESAAGGELAQKINDLVYLVTGEQPPLTSPTAAGSELGRVLRGRRVLLVIDDAWTRSQMESLSAVGDRTVRLVTTRDRGILPLDARTVDVTAMGEGEAHQLLTADLPPAPPATVTAVLGATGRWPTLLALVNAAARSDVAAGRSGQAALHDILTALRERGPTVLDAGDADHRHAAVASTIEVSLARLSTSERERFEELAVFGDDVDIPGTVLERYWAATAGWSDFDTHRFCQKLASLNLVLSYRRNPDRVALHDVIRGYVVGTAAPRLPRLHSVLLEAFRPLVENAEWWRLPDTEAYLWRWAPRHLRAAGLDDELRNCLHHPQWLVGKLRNVGPAALETDLSLADDVVSVELLRVVERAAHLLAPLGPEGSPAATLASRMPDDGHVGPIRKRLLDSIATPHLRPAGPLPDLPHEALSRVLGEARDRARVLLAAPDGSWLAAADGAELSLWDPVSGARTLEISTGLMTVSALAVAPDGSWLAAGGVEDSVVTGRSIGFVGSVRLYDPYTGAEILAIGGLPEGVDELEVAPDGAWLASAGGSIVGAADRDIRIWDPVTGRQVHRLAGHRDAISRLLTGADGAWLASASSDGTVKVWDPIAGALRHTFTVGRGGFRCLAADPAGRWLAATAGTAGSVPVWDLESGSPLFTLAGHTGEIHALTAAPDGAWLASGGSDGTLRIWDTASGTQSFRLDAGCDRVDKLAVAPDGAWLASGDFDGAVRVWDPRAGTCLRVLSGHASMISALTVAPDGVWLASAVGYTAGGDLRVWNSSAWSGAARSSAAEKADRTAVFHVAAAPDGDWLATSGRDGTVRLRAAGTGEHLTSLPTTSPLITALVVEPEARWLAAGGHYNGMVQLWNLDLSVRPPSTSPRMVLEVERGGSLQTMAVAPDGSWLACGHNGGGDILIWDPESGDQLHRFRGHDSVVWDLARPSDGAWLASMGGGTPDDEVRIWEPRTGRLCHTFRPSAGGLRALAVAPDGDWVAAGGTQGRIHVWDPRSGEHLHTLADPAVPLDPDALLVGPAVTTVAALAAAPDGSWLASGHWDGAVRVWNPLTGQGPRVLDGHRGDVTALSVSPDGGRLASVDGEGCLRVWDLTRAHAVASLRIDGALREVHWLPRAIAASGDQGLYLFTLRT